MTLETPTSVAEQIALYRSMPCERYACTSLPTPILPAADLDPGPHQRQRRSETNMPIERHAGTPSEPYTH